MEETMRIELEREIETLQKKLMNPRLDYKVTIVAMETSESFPREEVCHGYNEMDDALRLAYTKLYAMSKEEYQGDWRVVLTVTSYSTISQSTFGLVDPKVEYEKEIAFGDLERCQLQVFLRLKESERDKMLERVTDRENTLTKEEEFVLEKIARKQGMDCWFMVTEDRKAIVDLENKNKRLPLKQGIEEMIEGLHNVQEEGRFSLYEMNVFEKILNRFEISKDGLNLEREHECLLFLKQYDESFKFLNSMYPVLDYKEADIAGFKVIMGDIDDPEQQFSYYMAGALEQGYGYKDENTFNTHEHAICYISENGYEDYKESIKEVVEGYKNGTISKEDIPEMIDEIAFDCGNTKENFLALTGKEDSAKELFDCVDWQYPSTLWEEWQREEKNEMEK